MAAMDMLTGDQVRRLVALLYYLWVARNEAMWEGALRRPVVVSNRAVSAEAAYTAVHTHATRAAPTAAVPVAAGRLKCHFDAGYDPASGQATYVAVLIDHDGMFKVAANGKLPGCFSPLMAEALACKEVLSWLKNRNEVEVDVLTDCLVLKNVVCSVSTPNLSYVGIVVDQCKAAISSFDYCSPSFITRTHNLHAYSLARLAYDQDHSMY
ncbi:PREDICTED: uncharacterized protein LOC109156604 [Ipomoea nil]|uniref:uncharacterized protein LOC109156604 n=1 Tax=Ipomoea nil TaxID=35883 RepID=UPI00090140F6|nr:PREDICTED: uncharacterized protein LOC109156604 [Ipomoea nil]